MLNPVAIHSWADRQKRLLLATYNTAWASGVAVYAPDADPETEPSYPMAAATGGLTGSALLAVRRQYHYRPPASPDPVRRAVALAPSFRSVNKMAAELATLTPKPIRESMARMAEDYNPDEPRDYHGRWGDGGGTSKPLSYAEADKLFQDTFHPRQLRADTAIHPRSGIEVRVGKQLNLAGPDPEQATGPAVFKIIDNGQVTDPGLRFPHEIGTTPVTEVYRGVSSAEWTQAQERGYIQSNESGTIMSHEGTNAGVDPQTALSYLPSGGEGRILQIAVKPEDDWHTIAADGYLRTNSPVPIDRVMAYTPVITKDDLTQLRLKETRPLREALGKDESILHGIMAGEQPLSHNLARDDEEAKGFGLSGDAASVKSDLQQPTTNPNDQNQSNPPPLIPIAALATIGVLTGISPEQGPADPRARALETTAAHHVAWEKAKHVAGHLLSTPEVQSALKALDDAVTLPEVTVATASVNSAVVDAFRQALSNWLQGNAYRLDGADSVAWAGEQNGYGEAADQDGQLLAWSDTGDDHECADCQVLAKMPPQVLADWPCTPGDGATECNVGCRCNLEAVGDVLPFDTYEPDLSEEQMSTVSKLVTAQTDAMNSQMPDAQYLE